MVNTIIINCISFVSRCSHLSCRSRRFVCLLLVFVRRWGRMVARHHVNHDGKFIDRDSHWYARRVKEAIHVRLHFDNINRDNGIKILEACIPTIKKHSRRPVPQPSEQLQIGPLGKQLHSGTVRIETHQSQPTIVIHMVTRNQSTSSPDED